MFAALNEQDFLCRVFGDCLSGDPIDREVGDLLGAASPSVPKLFTYLRYNAEFTEEGLSPSAAATSRPTKCANSTPLTLFLLFVKLAGQSPRRK